MVFMNAFLLMLSERFHCTLCFLPTNLHSSLGIHFIYIMKTLYHEGPLC